MIILLAVLSSLILIVLGIVATFSILLYNRISHLLIINGAYQSEEYRNAVAVQKMKKPPMKPVTQVKRGREVVNQDEFRELSELDWETGIKAVEEAGK